MSIKKVKNVLAFETSIPVFSGFVAKGMGIGLLACLAIFGIVIALTILDGGTFSRLTPDIYFALGFVGSIFILTYIVMAIMFPHGFISLIKITERGVSQTSLSDTKRVSRAAIIGGILTGKPGAVGTGLLAEAGEDRSLLWKDLRIVKINSGSGYMYFSGGKFGLFPIGFFCPKKHYSETLAMVKKHYPEFRMIS